MNREPVATEQLYAWAKEYADALETNANAPAYAAPRLRTLAAFAKATLNERDNARKRIAQEAELRAALMDDDLGMRITVSPTKRFVVTLCKIDTGHTVATGLAQELDEAVRLALVDKNRRGE